MYRTALCACALTLFIASGTLAHTPKSVEAEFDIDKQILTVTVFHDVKDAAKHFVDEISIELNGEKIIEQNILAQENLEKQTVVYRITDAGVGDQIEISAACNISGKKKVTIKIEKKAEKEAEAE
jgi:hypothetical protein